MGEQTFCISFSFLPLHVFLSFILFLPFCFSFLSLFSHLIFLSFSLLLCHSLPFWMSIDRMGQKEAISSSFPQVSCVAINFPSLFFFSLFFFMTSSPTWLHMSHGIHFPHMANCESFLFMPSVTLLRCAPCGIYSPCHVSSDTPRLEKREIPTTSESNEIRRGS